MIDPTIFEAEESRARDIYMLLKIKGMMFTFQYKSRRVYKPLFSY